MVAQSGLVVVVVDVDGGWREVMMNLCGVAVGVVVYV